MRLPAYALLQMADQDRARIEAQSKGNTRWTMVHAGDAPSTQIKLMRNSRPTVLYRGQNRHFDPCWPSICRGFQQNTHLVADLDPIDRARLLRGLALNNWFYDELAKHPMMKWAQSEGIFLDATAIAQHYGIPTGYMDASESFEVSVFFATCRYVPKTASWEPMTKGEGVMFRLHVDAVDERAPPICYQPFPRPSQQWAWTVELRLGEDFLQEPMLQAFRFEHDASVGEEILRRFGGGPRLLPPDPTARLAQSMCVASEIPLVYVEQAEAQLAEDASGVPAHEAKTIRTTLQEALKVSLSNTSAVSYTREELAAAEGEWAKYSHEFYRGVGFHIVRTRLDGNEV